MTTTTERVIEIELPRVHAMQRKLFRSTARFIVACWGRRGGKSLAVLILAICICGAKAGARVWYIAETFPMVDLHMDTLEEMLPEASGVTWNKVRRRCTFPNGSYIQFKSGDKPSRLRGPGLDLLIIDEAAFMAGLKDTFDKVLRPALSDRKGRALIISTPNGLDDFHDFYQRGLDEAYPDWACFTAPSSCNPHLDADEIADAQRELPERIFRQEYLAEFIVDGGVVFRGVDACIVAEPQHAGPYVMGVDWGKRDDFTVLTVLDKLTGHVVAVDRMNQIDYRLQTQRLRVLQEQWQCEVILAERNSIGERLLEDLAEMGLPAVGFDTTNTSKTRIIEALALAIEKRELGLMQHLHMVTELKIYTVSRLPGGTFRYSAPTGRHDDCVMSLALAWEARQMASATVEWM